MKFNQGNNPTEKHKRVQICRMKLQQVEEDCYMLDTRRVSLSVCTKMRNQEMSNDTFMKSRSEPRSDSETRVQPEGARDLS
jgi:hypothetical protein